MTKSSIAYCALGRGRTSNLPVRTGMHYPLCYEGKREKPPQNTALGAVLGWLCSFSQTLHRVFNVSNLVGNLNCLVFVQSFANQLLCLLGNILIRSEERRVGKE